MLAFSDYVSHHIDATANSCAPLICIHTVKTRCISFTHDKEYDTHEAYWAIAYHLKQPLALELPSTVLNTSFHFYDSFSRFGIAHPLNMECARDRAKTQKKRLATDTGIAVFH